MVKLYTEHFDIEDTGGITFESDKEVMLCSIAISLKRLADHLAPNDGKAMPPLLWLGDVLREVKQS